MLSILVRNKVSLFFMIDDLYKFRHIFKYNIEYYRRNMNKEYSVKICHNCTNKENNNIETRTMTYYRSRTSSIYYFCSNECKKIYNDKNVCRYCSYYSDLVKVDEGYVVCISDEFWNPTCYDKYLIIKNKETCYFCHVDNSKNMDYYKVVNVGKKKYIVCDDCYDICENIKENNKNKKYCILCSNYRGFDENLIMCEDCQTKYSLMKDGIEID